MEIPYGYCHCGCGGKTKIIQRNALTVGLIKGQPRKYLCGHAGIKANWKTVRYLVEDRGYKTPCWVWQLALDRYGYGADRINRKSVKAHRKSYEKRFGPVSDDLPLDHLCKVRACINPEHLEPVTCEVNAQRNVNAKFTTEMVHLARKMWKEGHTSRRIAETLGVSQMTAYHAAIGRSWKNVV